jgi:hypothetical protein
MRNVKMEHKLTEEEVVKIACEAAKEYPNNEDLSIATLREQSGRMTWVVSSATVGRTLEVLVDDESGTVIEIKQMGVR